MARLLNLLMSGSRFLIVGLFVTVLSQTPTIQAVAADSGSMESKSQVSDSKQKADKDREVPREVDECFKDKGCLAQTVTSTSGQKSSTGTTCRSGMACTSPGASCSLGGTMHCRTIDLGGGNCACACTR
jgi:hypothetical protein